MVIATKPKLVSKLLGENERLQKCLILPSSHVLPGTSGSHVGLIQQALTILGAGVISPSEVSRQFYGPSTEGAVLLYKGPPRNIINRTYQSAPDSIVGQMTIERLDDDMLKAEVLPSSLLVSLTPDGARHDHSKCPRLQAGLHERTPINPQRFGRMINIFGDGETNYLGFEDFSTRIEFVNSPTGLRPLTFVPPERGGLKDNSASDICMRSAPITEPDFTKATGRPNTFDEIRRIAMPGCRITFAGEESEARKLFRLGPAIEKVEITVPVNDTNPSLGTKVNLAFVLVFLG